MSKYIASRKLLYTNPEQLLQKFHDSTGEAPSSATRELVRCLYKITDAFREKGRQDRAAHRPAAAPIEFDVWIRKNQSGAEEVDELLRAMIEAGYHDGYSSTVLPH